MCSEIICDHTLSNLLYFLFKVRTDRFFSLIFLCLFIGIIQVIKDVNHMDF